VSQGTLEREDILVIRDQKENKERRALVSQPLSVHGLALAFLLDVHRLRGAIERTLSTDCVVPCVVLCCVVPLRGD